MLKDLCVEWVPLQIATIMHSSSGSDFGMDCIACIYKCMADVHLIRIQIPIATHNRDICTYVCRS